jgi:hypothetical protein
VNQRPFGSASYTLNPNTEGAVFLTLGLSPARQLQKPLLPLTLVSVRFVFCSRVKSSSCARSQNILNSKRVLSLHSYLLRLLSNVPDADVGVRWGALASLFSFAVIRALSSSDYVAARYSFFFKPGIYFRIISRRVACWAAGLGDLTGDAVLVRLPLQRS